MPSVDCQNLLAHLVEDSAVLDPTDTTEKDCTHLITLRSTLISKMTQFAGSATPLQSIGDENWDHVRFLKASQELIDWISTLCGSVKSTARSDAYYKRTNNSIHTRAAQRIIY